MTVRTFHHDDEEFAHLQALNAELVAALKEMYNWAAKFENMLERESLSDEKKFGKAGQSARELIFRAKAESK